MRRPVLALAVTAALAAGAQAPAFGGPQEDLAACGAIADPTQRLACYDRVAGRPPAAPAAAAPAAQTAAPAVAPAPAQPAAAAAKPGAAPAPTQGADAATSFGSYSAEHPVTQFTQTLSVRVAALGKTIDGKPTVTLEGGALWLLDEKDPLLAIGDMVTLSRGLLGSFLLETPTRRMHHVRRIR